VYFVVVSEVGPGFLSTINYLIPAVAFVVGVLLLREPVAANQLIALAAILAGVWLIQPRHRSSS
jgi:drug/metabolite transporter (DMT)-like permease